MLNEKQTVRKFYDQIGWQKNVNGIFKNSAIFEDRRQVLADYYRKVQLRVGRFILPRGKYFLDAGAGAIPSTYSTGYEQHVCVDFSIKALQEARTNLKHDGLYVVADITKLPFKDDTFDTIMCAHTLYLIPEDEQDTTIREFYRTLRKNGRCVIIYLWPTSLLTKTAIHIKLIMKKLRLMISNIFIACRPGATIDQVGKFKPTEKNIKCLDLFPGIHSHNYHWFKETLPADWKIEMRCWGSIDRIFTETFVPDNIVGRIVINFIYLLETVFPHLMAKIGRHPMFIIEK